MITSVSKIVTKQTHEEKLGNLKYGTLVTGIESHPNSIYIKVDKNGCGQGTSVQYSRGYSVLLNVKLGSLREVRGNTVVTVLEGHLDINLAIAEQYCKGYCK